MGGKNKKKNLIESDTDEYSSDVTVDEEIPRTVVPDRHRRKRKSNSEDEELTEMLAELDLDYNKKKEQSGNVEVGKIAKKKNAGKKVAWAEDVDSDSENRRLKRGGSGGNRFANMMCDDDDDEDENGSDKETGKVAAMAKKKKNKGGKKDKRKKGWDSDDDDDDDKDENMDLGKKGGGKKGKESDDDDQDLGKKKGGKKNKKRKGGDSEDEGEEFGKKKVGKANKKKGGDSDEEEEFGKKKVGKKDKKKGGDSDEEEEFGKKKTGKANKKKGGDSDEEEEFGKKTGKANKKKGGDSDEEEEFGKKKTGKANKKKGGDSDEEEEFGKKKTGKANKKKGGDSDEEKEFGKKKTGKANKKKGGDSDEEEEFGKKKTGKANKKKGGDSDEEEEFGKKKGGKKDKKRKGDDSEDEDEVGKKKSGKNDRKKKGSVSDDDEDDSGKKKKGAEEESLGTKKAAKKDTKKRRGGDSEDEKEDMPGKKNDDDEDGKQEKEVAVEEKKDVKQKKGRKKRDEDEDDELANMLAELESEYNVDKKTTKDKKKDVVEEEKRKKDDGAKEKMGGVAVDKVTKGKEKVEVKEKVVVVVEKKAEPMPPPSTNEQQAAPAANKMPKGPGKKAIAAMQELARKQKEEEERAKLEEEEFARLEEERERQLKLKKEQELKEKKKRKERKERLKAEGKYLTPKQKAERARAEQMLNSLRAQGVRLPSTAAAGTDSATAATTTTAASKSKVVVYTSKLKKKPKNTKNNETNVETVEEAVVANESDAESEDDVKDAWDAELSDSDGNDDDDAHDIDVPKKSVADRTEVGNYMFFDDVVLVKQPAAKKPIKTPIPPPVQANYDHLTPEEARFEKAKDRIRVRRELAEQSKSADNLRAPIICVLGHVDTGKTKILDRLRRTNVQDGEAGGITQQIGATNVPVQAIIEQAKITHKFDEKSLKVPGLLIIDTPGHESFGNLRSRGSSLCDIAILVVDIMHGLEPQTLESIELLKTRKTPFVVALNKIDRLYNWKMVARKDVREVLKAQDIATKNEFKKRSDDIIVQFAEQKLNARMFYDNADYRTYIQVVPTSAITGEGMGNLLAVIVNLCQVGLSKRLMYSNEIKARVLEVKAIAGLGTTIDVVLVNGVLNEGDTIVLAGTEGPFATQIRSLLMPEPMRELRVKSAFIEHKQVRGAQGVKITGKELEKAIAGLNLLRADHADDVEVLKMEIGNELKSVMQSFKVQERGVYVQASTLGSLEALLEFLKTSEIPYCGVRIGPVAKRDVMKASVMLEHNVVYATILAFDVKIERDAQEMADSVGVKIFQADIIYHLFDKFVEYQEKLKNQKRDQFKHIAVFPCKLKILPQFMFNTRDPIVCGVMVEAGILQIGTPLCVPTKDFVDVGIVSSIESSHKAVEKARKGEEVCVKIEPTPGDAPKMFGRHFDENDFLVSKISRPSIDACKEYFREDLTKADWQLMIELKKTFSIL